MDDVVLTQDEAKRMILMIEDAAQCIKDLTKKLDLYKTMLLRIEREDCRWAGAIRDYIDHQTA
jgi:hypothetical protein